MNCFIPTVHYEYSEYRVNVAMILLTISMDSNREQIIENTEYPGASKLQKVTDTGSLVQRSTSSMSSMVV